MLDAENCNLTELEPELPEPGEPEGNLLDQVMEPFNPAEINIVVEPKSLDTLIERITHQEIDMNTDFQRHADLWDNQKMSRLIESVLIRFPLPAFYFDATNNENWLIVDGLQRLSAIRKFAVEKKLRLSGLEFLTDLNGQTYDQLHRTYQRRIKECPITVYLIKPGTPDNVKYSIFRRINTGGLTLNNQEIRNALAKPDDRRFLEKLASHCLMKTMLGDLSKRMNDQELVLRFWAFYRFDYLDKTNKKEMALFLDKAMNELRTGDASYRKEFEHIFELAIQRCHILLGEKGFEKGLVKVNGKQAKNSTLFEVWMVSFARLTTYEAHILENNITEFRKKVSELINDSDFF